MAKGCPHAKVRLCPLYVAANMGGGFGCDDGKLGEGDCAAARGLDYATALAQINRAHPEIVAERRWIAAKEASQLQRQLNMRTAGLS